jgi:hypothetical protein
MSDTTIIWEAMSVMVSDKHPIIYQYIKGRVKSRESAVMRITKMVAPIFIGAYDVSKVRGVAREFLKQKEMDYTQMKIKIKPIYD